MMTPKKERAIQSTLLLMLITTILLSFLCFNAFAGNEDKINTVPKGVGGQLTSLALVNKIDRFVIFGYSDRTTRETAGEQNSQDYSAQTVNDGNFGSLFQSFRGR
jgi:hypothetical protein